MSPISVILTCHWCFAQALGAVLALNLEAMLALILSCHVIALISTISLMVTHNNCHYSGRWHPRCLLCWWL